VPLRSVAIYALGARRHETMRGLRLVFRSVSPLRRFFLSIYLFIYSPSCRIALPSRSHFISSIQSMLCILYAHRYPHYIPSISGLSRHLPIDSPRTTPKNHENKGIASQSTPRAQLLRIQSFPYCWSLPVSTARPPSSRCPFSWNLTECTPHTRHVVISLPVPAFEFVLFSLAFYWSIYFHDFDSRGLRLRLAYGPAAVVLFMRICTTVITTRAPLTIAR